MIIHSEFPNPNHPVPVGSVILDPWPFTDGRLDMVDKVALIDSNGKYRSTGNSSGVTHMNSYYSVLVKMSDGTTAVAATDWDGKITSYDTSPPTPTRWDY